MNKTRLPLHPNRFKKIANPRKGRRLTGKHDSHEARKGKSFPAATNPQEKTGPRKGCRLTTKHDSTQGPVSLTPKGARMDEHIPGQANLV